MLNCPKCGNHSLRIRKYYDNLLDKEITVKMCITKYCDYKVASE